jgi:cytidine deaminase
VNVAQSPAVGCTRGTLPAGNNVPENLPRPDSLEHEARRAARLAYAPYSRFPVGAALATKSGALFSGCNVENVSFGLTNCAERTAVFSAVAAGHREIVGLVIYTPTPTPTAPCGACRQVLMEFATPDFEVRSICDGEDRLILKRQNLLPSAFGPASLSP